MPADIDVTLPLPGLSPVAGKPIITRFDGGSLSSAGNVLALCEIETPTGLAKLLAACVADPRSPECVVHSVADTLLFQMLMIAAGCEDANDAAKLDRSHDTSAASCPCHAVGTDAPQATCRPFSSMSV